MSPTESPDPSGLRVGWIGLGQIGRGMALRLADWPGGLVVFDLDPEAVAALTEQGAMAATSTAELAPEVDVVSVMVRTDRQVRDVATELLENGLAPGSVILVHSTIGPETAIDLAERADHVGVHVVDAPVSGGPAGAYAGTLAIMLGGSQEAVMRAQPVLERLGTKLVHAGPPGSATRMKLARNVMHFAAFAAGLEAARLAEAAGLDLMALGEVVRHSDSVSGGPGAILLRPTTAPIEPDDPWFGIMESAWGLGNKDMGFALELAEQLSVDMPIATAARERLRANMGLPPTEGDGDE